MKTKLKSDYENVDIRDNIKIAELVSRVSFIVLFQSFEFVRLI